MLQNKIIRRFKYLVAIWCLILVCTMGMKGQNVCEPSITLDICQFNCRNVLVSVSEWNEEHLIYWGDGSETSEYWGIKEYPVAGTYTITVWPFGLGGCFVSEEISIPGGPCDNPEYICNCIAGDYDILVNSDGCGSYVFQAVGIDFYSLDPVVSWEYGDGNAGGGVMSEHTYAASGTYNVSFSVNYKGSSFSCSLSESITVLGAQNSCDCDDPNKIEVIESGCGANRFDAPDKWAGIANLAWSFGDGTITTGNTAEHTYNANGTYTVILSEGGNLDSCFLITEVTVADLPNAEFSWVLPQACGMVVDLTVSDYGSNGGSAYWKIEGNNIPVTGANYRYTFTSPGAKDIELWIYSAQGCRAMSRQSVEVGGPAAYFEVEPTICLGQILPIGNVSLEGGIYSWDFGNGQTASGPFPQHVYSSVGTYTIGLTVTSVHNPGCRNVYSQQVQVQEAPGGLLLEVVANGCNDGSVDITYDGGGAQSVQIDWGAGPVAVNGSGTLSYTYGSPNTYPIRLIASNGGCTEELVRTVVIPARMELALTAMDDAFCAGGQTMLAAQILHPATDGEYTFSWALNGQYIPVTGPVITATEGGTYSVRARNQFCGQEVSANTTITVSPAPTATGYTVTSGNSCGGVPNGAVVLTVSQALATAGYQVNGGPVRNSTSYEVTGLPAGDNYLIINLSGDAGCSQVFTVNVPDESPQLSLSAIPSGCGGPSGGATVAVDGGVGPFTFQWFNTQDDAPLTGTGSTIIGNENIIAGIPAGQYRVEVTDANGCTESGMVVVPQMAIDIQLPANLATCADGGALPVTVTATLLQSTYQTADFAYTWEANTGGNWSELAVVGNATTLPPGDYRVTVRHNASGCASERAFSVTEYDPLAVEVVEGPPNCPNQRGTLTAVVSGGSGIYSYAWTGSNGGFDTAPHLPFALTGPYSLTVTDAAGCEVTVSGELEAASGDPIELIQLRVLESCQIEVAVSGGTGPYWYDWYQEQDVDVITADGDEIAGTNDVLTEQQEVFITHHAGGAVDSVSTAPFPVGTNEFILRVMDVNGCSYTFTPEVTIGEETTVPGFEFVWDRGDSPAPASAPENDPIVIENMAEAKNALFSEIDRCVEQQENTLMAAYTANCFSLDSFRDALTLSYPETEHHYTLYYFDRAGQLTKTVPPEGVRPLAEKEISALLEFRDDGGTVPAVTVPAHKMASTYDYNSLGQLMNQATPDGGRTRFIHDGLSRLRFSQNAEQILHGEYSYTRYDPLGRVVEVGQSTQSGLDFGTPTSTANEALADEQAFPVTDLSERTVTVYTDPGQVDYYGQRQTFLQNRVSYSLIDDDGDLTTRGDQYRTYYSYDIHGNVRWLVHEDPEIGQHTLAYDYDLISGKVLQVKLNEYRPDQFFHRYQYDAENRIVRAETSRDGVIWDRDAGYDYYLHGPLRRQELGEDRVQGIDYTYTIHGWLKGINTPGLDPDEDPGGDGLGNNPEDVPADLWGMNLGYFEGDFTRAGHPLLESNALFEGQNTRAKDLYNGNISHWGQSQVDLAADGTTTVKPARAGLYRYDLLNRLRSSEYFEQQNGGLTWERVVDDYSTAYEYDANGNIHKLTRYTDGAELMDELVYEYAGGNGDKDNNQLLSVEDTELGAAAGRGDLEGSHVYTYDGIGNMKRDTGPERLDLDDDGTFELYEVELEMDWTVYGKVKRVDKTIRSLADQSVLRREQIDFRYDAAGNRVGKTYRQDLDNDGVYSEEETSSTYYVRDAQGTEMAFYRRRNETLPTGDNMAVLTLDEQPIYGSDRLGVSRRDLVVDSVAYGTGEIAKLSVAPTGVGERSTLQNWVTSSNRSNDFGADALLCEGRLINIKFDPNANNDFSSPGELARVLGTVGNGVAVAEDLAGEVQFYVATVANYLGGDDACLFFDRTGFLLKGTEMAGVPEVLAKPVVVNLPGTQKWVVALLNGDGLPVYHVVDMAAQGFGAAAAGAMGAVTAVDLPLLAPDPTASYSYYFTGREDHLSGEAVIYTSRYVPLLQDPTKGTASLVAVAFDFDPLITPSAYPLYDLARAAPDPWGEIQIGPAGDALAWYVHGPKIAMFDHREVELHVIPLLADGITRNGPPLVLAASGAGNYEEGSVELGFDGDALLYSQRGVYLENIDANGPGSDKNIWRYDWATSQLSAATASDDFLFREVRRGADGRFYVLRINAADGEIAAMDGSGVVAEGLAVGNPVFSGELTSALPVQVWRFGVLGDAGAYTRVLGDGVYELKDHLGSVRVRLNTWRDNFPIISIEGLLFPSGTTPNNEIESGQVKIFQGKKKLEGLSDGYEYGLRGLYTRVARFISVDPLAVAYAQLSTYQFASNSTIKYIDIDGAEAYTHKLDAEITISGWESHVKTVLKKIHDGELNNMDFDCADLHVYIAITYHAKIGKEIIFKDLPYFDENYDLKKMTIKSSDKKWSGNIEKFIEKVRQLTGARDIQNYFSFRVPFEKKLLVGDMFNFGNHVAGLLSVEPNLGYNIFSASGAYFGANDPDNISSFYEEFRGKSSGYSQNILYRWNFLKGAKFGGDLLSKLEPREYVKFNNSPARDMAKKNSQILPEPSPKNNSVKGMKRRRNSNRGKGYPYYSNHRN